MTIIMRAETQDEALALVEEHKSNRAPFGAPLLKLFFDKLDSDGFLGNAATEVSWCIEAELNEWLQTNNVHFPHVMFVISNETRGEVSRKIVPLEQNTAFLTFNRGGENKITAVLLHGKNIRKLKSEWKTKDDNRLVERDDYEYQIRWPDYKSGEDDFHSKWIDGEYRLRSDMFEPVLKEDYMESETYTNDTCEEDEVLSREVFNKKRFDNRLRRQGIQTRNIKDLFVEQTVTIDPELFAKEPNKHLMFFINLWHEKKLHDQCHMRQRFIFLALIKIWPILIWSIFRTVIGTAVGVFMWACGSRDVDWEEIWPWTGTFEYIAHSCSPKNNYLIRGEMISPWLWPAAPIGWLIAAPIITILLCHNDPELMLLSTYITVVSYIVAFISLVVMIIGCAFGIICGFIMIGSMLDDSKNNIVNVIFAPIFYISDKIYNFYYRERPDEDQAYRDQMACPINPNEDYIKPLKHHSLWHRIVVLFNRTKAKVCKPFPG